MNKTRFAVKAVTGAVVTAVLLMGSLAAPAQAKDTGWPTGVKAEKSQTLKDTGWPTG